MKNTNIYSVITAAGRSRRMQGTINGNKVYEKINGRTILAYSLEKFMNLKCGIRGIIVVAAPDEIEYCQTLAMEITKNNSCEKTFKNFFIKVTAGGSERTDSVYNGIKALLNEASLEESFVFIHDGARPAFSSEIADKMAEELNNDNSLCGITMALPSYDTLCKVSDNFEIESYEDRKKIYRISTPQIFKLNVLNKCFEMAASQPEIKAKLTDETTLLKYFKKKVKIFEGNPQNIKITTPADIEYIKKILT